MWRLLYAYLRVALFFNLHGHVYRLCQKWGRKADQWNSGYFATFYIQPLLLAKGYHKCPYCSWVTQRPNEHLQEPGTLCYEFSLPLCPVCNCSLYPEDTAGCRYCVLDKDVEAGTAMATEIEAAGESFEPVLDEKKSSRKRGRQEDLCKCGEHMFKAGSRWVCPVCDI